MPVESDLAQQPIDVPLTGVGAMLGRVSLLIVVAVGLIEVVWVLVYNWLHLFRTIVLTWLIIAKEGVDIIGEGQGLLLRGARVILGKLGLQDIYL